MSSKPKNHPCPQCGSKDWIPIIYGYPNPELFEEYPDGGFALGGCCVGDEDPNWECKKCECQIYIK